MITLIARRRSTERLNIIIILVTDRQAVTAVETQVDHFIPGSFSHSIRQVAEHTQMQPVRAQLATLLAEKTFSTI